MFGYAADLPDHIECQHSEVAAALLQDHWAGDPICMQTGRCRACTQAQQVPSCGCQTHAGSDCHLLLRNPVRYTEASHLDFAVHRPHHVSVHPDRIIAQRNHIVHELQLGQRHSCACTAQSAMRQMPHMDDWLTSTGLLTPAFPCMEGLHCCQLPAAAQLLCLTDDSFTLHPST